jgi:steroid 5-alpha reductase family enzyme
MTSLTPYLSAAWSLVTIALFVWAVRLSYRIEARSPLLANRSSVPRFAAMLHTVTNWNVAPDNETQRLRRRMNLLLALILAGFVLFAAAITFA